MIAVAFAIVGWLILQRMTVGQERPPLEATAQIDTSESTTDQGDAGRTQSVAGTTVDSQRVSEGQARWVEGRVIVPAGTPSNEQAFVVAHSDHAFEGRTGEGSRTKRFAVGNDGTFRLSFPAESKSGTLQVEGLFLYSPNKTELDLNELPGDITLRPELGGRVVGQLNPPHGTEFAPSDFDDAWASARHLGAQDRDIEIDSSGRFELNALEPRQDWWVAYGLPAHVNREHSGVEVRPGEVTRVEYTVQAGARVSGRVFGADDAGIEGLIVRAMTSDYRETTYAKTDASGAFEFAGLFLGDVEIRIEAPGFLDLKHPLGTLSDGDVLDDLELRLSRGSAISGHVRWPDGSPAAEAEVRAISTDKYSTWYAPGEDRTSKTDAEGAFSIGALDQESYALVATGRAVPDGSKLRDRIHAPWGITTELNVLAGTSSAHLVLGEGLIARGRVVNDLGLPVTEFKLSAEPGDELGMGSKHSPSITQSFESADGTFELRGLGDDKYFVSAVAKGYAASYAQPFPVPTNGELVLITPRFCELAGVLIDEGGRQVPDARIMLMSDGGGFPNSRQLKATEKDGSFRIRRLAPGHIEVHLLGEDSSVRATLELFLEPGQVIENYEWRLEPSASVRGELHESVADVAGRMVRAIRSDSPSGKTVQTDSAGRFTIDGLSPGDYTLVLHQAGEHNDDPLFHMITARSEAVDRQEVSLLAGEELFVVLGGPEEHSIGLRGTTSRAGVPVEGVSLVCRRVDARFDAPAVGRARSDQRGEYSMELSELGSFELTVTDEKRNKFVLPLEVATEESRQFDIQLPQSLISGIVVGPDGPLAGASGWAHLERPTAAGIKTLWRNFRTDGNGHFVLTDLPAGTYEVGAYYDPTGVVGATDQAALAYDLVHGIVLGASSERTDLRLELQVGGVIEGVVLGTGGGPVEGAVVWFKDPADANLLPSGGELTDVGGRFRGAPLRPGPVNVFAVWNDQAFSEVVAVEVLNGGKHQIQVRFVN